MKLDSISKLRSALYCAISVFLIFGIFWSVRQARADYEAAQPDYARVLRACQMAPGSAAYWSRSAAVREVEEPGDPAIDAAIDRALALNPRSTEAWLTQAIRHENAGRVAEAERDYLAAATHDHMYKPAWALANFYVRHDQPEKFWIYARKCLEVVEPRRLEPSSYNPAPVFDLAWRLSQNAAEIRRRLIPPRHFILVDYLDFLSEHNLTEAGADVAIDLTSYGDPGDNFYLANFCERLINLAKGKRAVDVWNAMVDHAIVRTDRLDPERGQSLSNADFKRPFERAGFDWRLPPAEGVLQNQFLDTGEVRFEFSGDQREGVLTMFQSIPVVGGRAYRLRFQYRTPGMEHANGLGWEVWDYGTQRLIPVTGRLTPREEWSAGEATFVIPRGTSIVRLGLVYQRATGSTRIHGTTAFSGMALQFDKSRGLN